MDTFVHIAERSVYHVVGGMALMPLLQAVWFECRRRGLLPRLTGVVVALVPVIAVLTFVALREPWDAAANPDMWWKSWVDYSTWTFGCGLAAWMQVRYCVRNAGWARETHLQLGARWASRLGLLPRS